MSKPKLVLYFDVVSPFAYLAFHILHVCKLPRVSFLPTAVI